MPIYIYIYIYMGFIIGLLVAGVCFSLYTKLISVDDKNSKPPMELVDKQPINWDNYAHLIMYILVILGMILNVIAYSF